MKISLTSGSSTPWQKTITAWTALPVHWQRGFKGLALLLCLFTAWIWGLQPALALWREAPAQHLQLDAKLQTMQIQAQALQTLQGQPRADPARAMTALAQSLLPLGEQASLSHDGVRATVQLQGVPAAALADWLSSVRLVSQTLPIEAELNRSGAGHLWDGRVVLALPQP